MREKLAALEDLNELLEEPVEEQVSYIFLLHTLLKFMYSEKANKFDEISKFNLNLLTLESGINIALCLLIF